MSNIISPYSYTIEIGPLALKRKAQLPTDLKNLKTLLSCLKKAEAAEPGFLAKLKVVQSEVSVKLTRIWNLLFGTRQWYNEDRARQILKHYSTQHAKLAMDAQPETAKAQEKQLLAVYERLEKLSAVEGRDYLKGVNKDDLLPSNPLKELLDLLPEMKELQKCMQPLITMAGKKSAQYALQILGQSLAGSFGERAAPFLGVKAAKLMQAMLFALAKDFGVDLVNKNVTVKPATHHYDNHLAIVPYRG